MRTAAEVIEEDFENRATRLNEQDSTEIFTLSSGILHDLEVGDKKPLGNLPTKTVRALGMDPDEIASEARQRGLIARVYPDESTDKPFRSRIGSISVAEPKSLDRLLRRYKRILRRHRWPTTAESFMDRVHEELVPRESPVHDIITRAFGNNPQVTPQQRLYRGFLRLKGSTTNL